MSRPDFEILDGPNAAEWRQLGLGQVRLASHRATTSSRTPGKVNRGVVYKRAFEHPELHLCTCGQTQALKPCGHWVCEAPGHAKHDCEHNRGTI